MGSKRRIANGSGDGGLLVFIEVQSGDDLGEDDIKRFEDDIDRAKSFAPAAYETTAVAQPFRSGTPN